MIPRLARWCGLCLTVLLAGCTQGSPAPMGNTPGDIVYGKLIVYGDLLKKELPLDWRKSYSTIFLEGTPAEQQIFLREFHRHNYPVKDISFHVPPYYSRDADASTGAVALYFSATLIESHPDLMVFEVIHAGFSGENHAIVQRVKGEWTLKEWTHHDTGVYQ